MARSHIDRPLGPALMKGLRYRCPRCGRGTLFRSYLKIVERCEACQLDLSNARADDLPPYVAITIVGHILVIGIMHFEMTGAHVAPWVYLVWTLPLAVVLPLLMLPSIKGGVVAFQWSKGMHGLGDD